MGIISVHAAESQEEQCDTRKTSSALVRPSHWDERWPSPRCASKGRAELPPGQNIFPSNTPHFRAQGALGTLKDGRTGWLALLELEIGALQPDDCQLDAPASWSAPSGCRRPTCPPEHFSTCATSNDGH